MSEFMLDNVRGNMLQDKGSNQHIAKCYMLCFKNETISCQKLQKINETNCSTRQQCKTISNFEQKKHNTQGTFLWEF